MTTRFVLILMAICGLAVLAEPRTATAAISPDAAARWQGWYAGVDAGLADTSNSWSAGGNIGVRTPLTAYGTTTGLVGGYNRVRNDGLFYGGEADVNYMSNAAYAWGGQKSVWDGYATARGRIGLAFDPALVFLTGGLALSDVENRLYSQNLNSEYLHVGWTVGAGAEFALTDNISMSAQYLRLQMPQNASTFYNPFVVKMTFDNSADILRVGVNWHFE